MLHFKRFDNYGTKLSDSVHFPQQLSIGRLAGSSDESKYNLCSVIVHSGRSIRYGHYFAFVKN